MAVSQFSDVDGAPDVGSLVAYLDGTDRGLSPMKSYIAASAAMYVPGGVVLDIGCGVGRDLERLRSLDLRGVGIDLSTWMLTTARQRLGTDVPLVQADAARLPLRAASVDGCRIERVLQHVESPRTVVEEIARVVRPGGFVAAFDTDHRSYRAETDCDALAGLPGSISRVLHPGVGGELVTFFADAGFEICNVVTERSHASSIEGMPTNARASIARAVREGALDPAEAKRWIDEQVHRSAIGTFRATWEKILVTATRT
jgi:SAM-dependent methyltransferase